MGLFDSYNFSEHLFLNETVGPSFYSDTIDQLHKCMELAEGTIGPVSADMAVSIASWLTSRIA